MKLRDEYEHTVEMVNLDEMVVMVKLWDPAIGYFHALARIDKLTVSTDDQHEVPQAAAIAGFACTGHYKLGKREFTIPLGDNMGAAVGIGVNASPQ